MIILTDEQRMLLGKCTQGSKTKDSSCCSGIGSAGRVQLGDRIPVLGSGAFQMMLPEEYGGWPLHPCHTLCLCIEEIAKGSTSSALMLIIQAVGSFPLIHAGSDTQKKKYFPMLSEKRKLIGYLVTEPGAGSDVAAITTKAQQRGHHYVLTGHKIFATNGGSRVSYSVLAKTGETALSFFIVERPWKGVTVGKHEDKCGFRGSDTSEVFLEEVEVPEENLVGKEGSGFLIAMADFDMSRPTVATLSLGIAEGALGDATEYAGQRHTFGKALITHQPIQFMLADGLTLIEAGRGLMEKAAMNYDAGLRNTTLASMAKCFCSDAAMKITTDMVQVLGGYGYVKDYPLERMFRDAKLTQIFEGANQIQQMVIGQEILRQGV